MQGISIRNNDNHILVSSDIRSFHYLGDASLAYNLASGLTTFDNYGYAGSYLSGRCLYTFSINSSIQQAPLVFIQPGLNSNTYGILRKYWSAGAWYIDILQSGPTVAYPRVLCFNQLSGITSPAGGKGIATYLSNGEIAFDSTRGPMAIHDVKTVIQQEVPCDTQPTDYSYNNWNLRTFLTNYGDYHNDTTYNSYNIISAPRENIAFTAPSIAQAVYDNTYYGYYKSCGYGGSCQEHKSWTIFWGMYQGTYGLAGSNSTLQLKAAWSIIRAGYYFSQYAEDGGWFGGGGVSYTSGDRPYTEKTINLQENPIIMIDASNYG
jgi:hypothetical protein